jgi:hypothetical protein
MYLGLQLQKTFIILHVAWVFFFVNFTQDFSKMSFILAKMQIWAFSSHPYIPFLFDADFCVWLESYTFRNVSYEVQ